MELHNNEYDFIKYFTKQLYNNEIHHNILYYYLTKSKYKNCILELFNKPLTYFDIINEIFNNLYLISPITKVKFEYVKIKLYKLIISNYELKIFKLLMNIDIINIYINDFLEISFNDKNFKIFRYLLQYSNSFSIEYFANFLLDYQFYIIYKNNINKYYEVMANILIKNIPYIVIKNGFIDIKSSERTEKRILYLLAHSKQSHFDVYRHIATFI